IYLVQRSEIVSNWWSELLVGHWGTATAPNEPQSGWSLVGASFSLFPKLALGLSGFELTMIVMPLIRGDCTDDASNSKGRTRATRKLLFVAALVGSLALLASSTVTSLLIPPRAFAAEHEAKHRALAYLAHGGQLADGTASLNPIFGIAFGTIYDLSAV